MAGGNMLRLLSAALVIIGLIATVVGVLKKRKGRKGEGK